MGLNTLVDRTPGTTIEAAHPNAVHQALNGDFVGRGATGICTAGQNLGTVALPWGVVRTNSIVVSGQTVDPSLVTIPQNVIISGAKRSSSNQPFYLVPNGAALSVVIDGTPTSLVYDVNGTSFTLSADLTISSLTAAPSTNNTCLINQITAVDQDATRYWGEYGVNTTIIVDTMGSEISALVGKFAAFSIAGATTEYFIAYVKSTTELTHCIRGAFLDSTGAPVKPAAYSDNDVITLLKLGAVFLDDDAVTTSVSYTNPTWSFTAPTSPVTNDYWYDLSAQTWKRYDGASWVIIGRTFLGYICNTTTACVGARAVDFYWKADNHNSLELELSTTEIVISREGLVDASVSVAGTRFYFNESRQSWNMTTDLAGSADMINASEQASTMYHLFLKDTGARVISDIAPIWRPDLGGWYHRYNPWRAIGFAYNNASSNLGQAGGRDLSEGLMLDQHFAATTTNLVTNRARFVTTVRNLGASAVYLDDGTDGTRWIIYDPGYYEFTFTWTDNATVSLGVAKNLVVANAISVAFGTNNLMGLGVSGPGVTDSVTATAYLKIGDLVAGHLSAGAVSNSGNEAGINMWVTRRVR